MSDGSPTSVAAGETRVIKRYERIASGFGHRVRSVPAGRWDDPSPCEGWVARDVVRHLVEWVPGFLSSFAGSAPPDLPPVDNDPVGAWATLDGTLRAHLHDPEVSARPVGGPMGTTTVAGAIDRFITTDILLHTWDLARATGLDDRLDPGESEGMLEELEPLDDVLRDSGHYGPRVDVPPDAPYQDRLLAFLGRDPSWVPPDGHQQVGSRPAGGNGAVTAGGGADPS